MAQDYQDKGDAYFASARHDIELLLPAHSARALELGCGSGATLAWLKASGRATYTTGIEIFAAAAGQAAARVDAVHCLDFESGSLPLEEPYDLVLCLDVLEHFVDPWRAVDRLVREQLRVGGTIVISVPNIRHYRVLAALVLRGRWDYADEGPLDRTHLRFFTRRSAIALLHHPQLGEARCVPTGFAPGSAKSLVNSLTLGVFRDFLAFHYLVAAVKTEGVPT